jgi:hypothetical protein
VDPWRLLHFGLLCAWAAVVVVEVVIELASSEAPRLHYLIDLSIELPLIVGVSLSGSVLLSRVWPPPPLLRAKIACAVVAIAINLYCAVFVAIRHRAAAETRARYTRHVRASILGLPFAVAAAWIGLAYYH